VPEVSKGAGRPREEKVDEAIVRATRAVLAERGYAGLTVDAVAAAAGVGKAAIYRRHATKQEMIFAATVHDLALEAPSDGASLAADLVAVAEGFAEQLGRAPADVLAGLLADIYGDPALAERFAATFLVRQQAVLEEVLDRAVGRNELAQPVDVRVAHALLLGPVFAWMLIVDGDPDRTGVLARLAGEAAASALLGTGRGDR
jgi:AcrR family transcriptional regulator